MHLLHTILPSFILLFCIGCSANSEKHQVELLCQSTFYYSIGEIDSRFNISQSDVERTVEEAIKLWESADSGFEAQKVQNAPNVIHFVYDERHAYFERERQFQDRITVQNLTVEGLKIAYENQNDLVDRLTQSYNTTSSELQSEIERVNSWTEEVNRGGGFTSEQSNLFEVKRARIDSLRNVESRERQRINREIQELNSLTDQVNQEVGSVNRLIEEFNQQFGGEWHFSSGLYTGDGRTGTISVFHFKDKRELKILLAHEIGHAIGLGHVENPTSIMYEMIGGQLVNPTIELTEEDIEAIINLCN